MQRLEAEASRKFAEKQRRLKQELERKLQQQLKQKVAARSFAKVYLAELNASVFSTLEQEGKFYDLVKRKWRTPSCSAHGRRRGRVAEGADGAEARRRPP